MATFEVIAIDTGGTFVDFVGKNKETGKLKILKIPASPDDPSASVIRGLQELKARSDKILFGTTVATNAIIERKGKRVALFTTKGFKDVIEIGRQNRQDIYELKPSRPAPLVSRENRIEIEERINSDGGIDIPFEASNAKVVVEQLDLENIDAFAICFLFSFINPSHEQQMKKLLSSYGKPISTSHEIYPEYREYERTSTTVIDAYIKPVMDSFIRKLASLVVPEMTEKLAIMKSSTGLATPEGIVRKPVETLLSGLAGGVLAAEYAAKQTEYKNLICLDIGGTSTDVAQIYGGKGKIIHQIYIDGLPTGVSAVDIKTIGAGGGSIAKIEGGFLKVGPESAAGKPGPAAYGLGGKNATVTDADLVYGILGEKFAGGKLTLQTELAEVALEKVAKELNVPLSEAVSGIRSIFHENIAAALRAVSTERGIDPRAFGIVAFGGAGPVHGVEVAELLNISTVLIPPYPGIWSAFGLLSADYRFDFSRGLVLKLDKVSIESFREIYDELTLLAIKAAKEDKLYDESNCRFVKQADLRFLGQSYDISIEWEVGSLESLKSKFINAHKELYGFAAKDQQIEIVAVRLTLVISHETPELVEIDVQGEMKAVDTRKILNSAPAPVYLKSSVPVKKQLSGPLIIDQLDTTTWVPSGWECMINRLGFIIITKIETTEETEE